MDLNFPASSVMPNLIYESMSPNSKDISSDEVEATARSVSDGMLPFTAVWTTGRRMVTEDGSSGEKYRKASAGYAA